MDDAQRTLFTSGPVCLLAYEGHVLDSGAIRAIRASNIAGDAGEEKIEACGESGRRDGGT